MRVLFAEFSASSVIRSWASRLSILSGSKSSSRGQSRNGEKDRKSSASSGSGSESELCATGQGLSRQAMPHGQYSTSAYPPTTTTTITAGGPVPVHHSEFMAGAASQTSGYGDVVIDTDIHSYHTRSPASRAAVLDTSGSSGDEGEYAGEYAQATAGMQMYEHLTPMQPVAAMVPCHVPTSPPTDRR